MFQAADSSGSLDADAGASDITRTVFAFAPYWVFTSSWHCQHPSDNSSESSFIQFSEPLTTDEVLQLYKNRQMKGSNLVVGLSSGSVAAGKTIPSAFYRTLAYLFELAKMGTAYAPLTEEDITRGTPLKGWCEPLWLRSSDEGCLSIDAEDLGSRADPAYHLLMSAPYWCYLYNHEPSRAKKTPPKDAAQMLDMFRTGCLPPWTPVIGLQEDVSTFNSLPPSLFMPLGALLHLAASGSLCKAVGLSELTRWDKFIGSRTSNGCTQGQGVVQSGLTGRPSRGHSQAHASFTTTSSMSQPRLSLQGANSGSHGNQGMAPTYYPNQHTSQQPNSFYNMHVNSYMPYQMHPNAHVYPSPFGLPASGPPAATAAPSMHMMWGYGQTPGQAGPFASSTDFGAACNFGGHHSAPPLSMPGKSPLQVDHSGWASNRRSSGSAGKKGNNRSLGFAPQTPGMMPPGGMAPHMPPYLAVSMLHGSDAAMQQGDAHNTRLWDTALFRLFTADSTRGTAHAAWWRISPEDGRAAGPFNSEQMIIDYARGALPDNHLVCGTTSDVPSHMSPSPEMFESVGSLLSQVELEGQYALVTLSEIMDASRSAAAAKPAAHISAGFTRNPKVSSGRQQQHDTSAAATKTIGFWDAAKGQLEGQGGELCPTLLMGEHIDAAVTVKAVFMSGGNKMSHGSGGVFNSGRDQEPRAHAVCQDVYSKIDDTSH